MRVRVALGGKPDRRGRHARKTRARVADREEDLGRLMMQDAWYDAKKLRKELEVQHL